MGIGLLTPAASAVPANNDAVFAALLDDIDAIYADLDTSDAFVPIKHSSGGDSLALVDRRLHAKSLFLDHDEATTVPFELRVAQQALWRVIGSQR